MPQLGELVNVLKERRAFMLLIPVCAHTGRIDSSEQVPYAETDKCCFSTVDY